MAPVLLLLLLVAYIFAVTGITIYQPYIYSNAPGIVYHRNFSDLSNAFITLFILFTTDHWRAILDDAMNVPEINPIVSGGFIILWIVIVAFMIRSIFVGILVSNFKSTREDLSREVQWLQDQQKADHFKTEIISRRSHSNLHREVTEDEKEEVQDDNVFGSSTGFDWATSVEQYMQLMKHQGDNEHSYWPEDYLFRYFELLEELQVTLAERESQQKKMAQIQLNFYEEC